MSAIKIIDRLAFSATIVSGAVAAISGGFGWAKTAIVSGCLAALFPILNRIASNRAFAPFEPRTLTLSQRNKISKILRQGPTFDVWVAHNRQEAEPSAYHAKLCEALKDGGINVNWFGGMSNNSVGLELSGPENSDKARLCAALDAARVKYQPIILADDTENKRFGIALWVGVRT